MPAFAGMTATTPSSLAKKTAADQLGGRDTFDVE